MLANVPNQFIYHTTVRRLINHRHDFYSAEKWRNRAKRLTFMLCYREKNTEIGFK